MKVEHKKTGLDGKHEQFFPALAAALETQYGGKFVAEKADDELVGYYVGNGDDVEIHFYEEDEAPNKEHTQTYKKLATLPDEANVKSLINGVGVNS